VLIQNPSRVLKTKPSSAVNLIGAYFPSHQKPLFSQMEIMILLQTEAYYAVIPNLAYFVQNRGVNPEASSAIIKPRLNTSPPN